MQVVCVLLFGLVGFVVCKPPTKIRTSSPPACGHSGNGQLQYIWGEALESTDCLGPHGLPYPTDAVNRIVEQASNLTRRRGIRSARESNPLDPLDVRNQLLDGWISKNYERNMLPQARSIPGEDSVGKKCASEGSTRLCATQHNTTAPLFGISMTSGRTVAIVQKFPDLLQQIVYEKCLSRECRVVKGECSQTFVPYLFLTVPLGPVTLTGQDYVLVESGCVCRLPNNPLHF